MRGGWRTASSSSSRISSADSRSAAHIPLLLGIIVTAVGIHAAIAHPADAAEWPAEFALAGGIALFLVSDRRVPAIAVSITMAAAVVAVPASVIAQEPRWSVELFAGSALSVPTPLRIAQAGESELRLRARYATRPWSGAPYYAYRVGRRYGLRAWELELVHHKLYLRNAPSEVQQFDVTHGYNLVFVNRAVHARSWAARVGIGPVVTHPENVVRGRRLDSDRGGLGGGYYVSGVAGQLAASRRMPIGRSFALVAEGKLTAAYARVRVVDGRATVPNVAAHALVGVGYSKAR